MKRSRERTYQVNEVARLAGVSVRTLHHYDAIGLLVPRRTESGYRLYDDDALLRLQQILIGREPGLSLEEIRRSLDDPKFDRRQALVRQREQLAHRAEQTRRMIRGIDRALEAIEGRQRQEAEVMNVNMKEIFDGFDPSEYEAETKERWGNTDSYRESMKRTSSYTKAEWERFRDEQAAIYSDAVLAMKAGGMPEDDATMDIAVARTPHDRSLVLSLQPRDASRARGHVRGRRALRAEHRHLWGRSHALPFEGDPRERPAPRRIEHASGRRADDVAADYQGVALTRGEEAPSIALLPAARRPVPHTASSLWSTARASISSVPARRTP